MITKEEFEKAVNYCASDPIDCKGCPLCASDMCSVYLAEYIKSDKKTYGQKTQGVMRTVHDDMHDT